LQPHFDTIVHWRKRLIVVGLEVTLQAEHLN
jgi:hypothetical protein